MTRIVSAQTSLIEDLKPIEAIAHSDLGGEFALERVLGHLVERRLCDGCSARTANFLALARDVFLPWALFTSRDALSAYDIFTFCRRLVATNG
ncbi:hypothetical protein [Pseudomonas sp. SJZ124]|uniref:hypothetical protein n=1 Tax=Pseudomonas sp. SJZ124 TaxID=2572894 RepID=UPI0011A2256D|nr:hypothetical protein [Pseudomonas sp. SJZ124]